MNTYKMDFASKTLTITKAFAEAAADPNSAEYRLMRTFQKDIPGLKIVRRTHKTPAKYKTKNGDVIYCNQYKHLTYENMERFISSIKDNDAYMEVYNTIRNDMGLVQYNRYSIVRSWFAAQFPKYREDPIFYMNNKVDVITEIAPFILAAMAAKAKREEKKSA